jgi:signal transduction histidine kinase
VRVPVKVASSWTTSVARGSLLVICGLISTGSDRAHPATIVGFLLAFMLLGIVGAAPLPALSLRLLTLLEAAIWVWAVLDTGSDQSPFLPYLLAPAFVAGLRLGWEGVLVPVAIAAVAVLSAAPSAVSADRVSDVLGPLSTWVALALMVGLLASWIRALELRQPGEESYLHTYRLLSELRAMARRLPAGWDGVATAEAVLREVRSAAAVPASGTVLVRSHGDRLSVLASTEAQPNLLADDLRTDTAYAEAWTGQRPTWQGQSLIMPLVAGNRTNGLLVLGPLPEDTVRAELEQRIAASSREGALRLETALLFEELRQVATAEERHRVAREIHDGVAQDLAAFGYQLDALSRNVATVDREELATQLRDTRQDLGRLVRELRHSIFELRTDARSSDSLGAALGDYVRNVAVSTGLAVHLTLEETAARLTADTEAELLRIAQEAISNSRRHAQARNLWIRCEVSPPRALLVIEDDGIGPVGGRADSAGIQIMRERATRLRASLEVGPREPTGTVVRCELGNR